jgi:SAM-dependent methyltransferase
MAYQNPLAYLLGIEGAALLRAFAGDYDREFTQARIAEIRRLLADPALSDEAVTTIEISTVEGYAAWAATYDEPGNGLYPHEEPLVEQILATLAPGVAVDAACGTGRHTARLAARGHQVIGVDSSPDMLQRARERVPQAEFRQGDLQHLPVPDDQADLVVCALALTHCRDLAPVFAEFARVLKPGGHLVTTDIHQELVALGSVPRARSTSGRPGLVSTYRHYASDYLAAALPHGLQVRRCEEPRPPGALNLKPMAEPLDPGPWDGWPWSMLNLVPTAAGAVSNGVPAVIVWHFQLL